MNRADLDARNTAAIRRHARALADNDMRATRALLDDLARIADEHATTLRDDYGHGDGDSTGAAPLVAADGTEAPGGGNDLPSATESRTVAVRTPRTRTRTRGGPK